MISTKSNAPSNHAVSLRVLEYLMKISAPINVNELFQNLKLSNSAFDVSEIRTPQNLTSFMLRCPTLFRIDGDIVSLKDLDRSAESNDKKTDNSIVDSFAEFDTSSRSAISMANGYSSHSLDNSFRSDTMPLDLRKNGFNNETNSLKTDPESQSSSSSSSLAHSQRATKLRSQNSTELFENDTEAVRYFVDIFYRRAIKQRTLTSANLSGNISNFSYDAANGSNNFSGAFTGSVPTFSFSNHWINIRSLVGHLSQAPEKIRNTVGTAANFRDFLLRHNRTFELQGDLVGLTENYQAMLSSLHVGSKQKRCSSFRTLPQSSGFVLPSFTQFADTPNSNNFSRNNSMRANFHQKKTTFEIDECDVSNRKSLASNLYHHHQQQQQLQQPKYHVSASSTDSPCSPFSQNKTALHQINSNNANSSSGSINCSNLSTTICMTPEEYQSVLFIYNIISSQPNKSIDGPALVLAILRSKDSIQRTIGTTLVEIKEFISKNFVFFKITQNGSFNGTNSSGAETNTGSVFGSIEKCVFSVQIRNPNDKSANIVGGDEDGENIMSPTSMNILLIPAIQSNSINNGQSTLSSAVGSIFSVSRQWGIIDLGRHEHVFFDKSIFLHVDDLTKHFQVGDIIYFNAILAPKTSRAKWRATKVWKQHDCDLAKLANLQASLTRPMPDLVLGSDLRSIGKQEDPQQSVNGVCGSSLESNADMNEKFSLFSSVLNHSDNLFSWPDNPNNGASNFNENKELSHNNVQNTIEECSIMSGSAILDKSMFWIDETHLLENNQISLAAPFPTTNNSHISVASFVPNFNIYKTSSCVENMNNTANLNFNNYETIPSTNNVSSNRVDSEITEMVKVGKNFGHNVYMNTGSSNTNLAYANSANIYDQMSLVDARRSYTDLRQLQNYTHSGLLPDVENYSQAETMHSVSSDFDESDLCSFNLNGEQGNFDPIEFYSNNINNLSLNSATAHSTIKHASIAEFESKSQSQLKQVSMPIDATLTSLTPCLQMFSVSTQTVSTGEIIATNYFHG